MPGTDFMPTQVKQIGHSGMGTEKSLSLPYGFERPHPSLSHPGRFMGLLCPIILILLSTVDRFRNQLPMSNTIAAQFVSHDLPGFTAMARSKRLKNRLAAAPSRFA